MKKIIILNVFIFTLSFVCFAYARCCPGDCCVSDAAKLSALTMQGMPFSEVAKVATQFEKVNLEKIQKEHIEDQNLSSKDVK